MTDELKPLLPCPCCNGTPSLMYGPGGDIWVKCPVCGLQTEMHPNNAAIAAWNRRAELLKDAKELPPWLIERLKNTIYGHKQAGDGKDYRDGYHAAIEWVLSLKKEDK